MSKASAWAKKQTEFDTMVSSWALHIEAINPRPRFTTGSGVTQGAASVQTNGCLSVRGDMMFPEEAVRLARWILEMFEDVPHA